MTKEPVKASAVKKKKSRQKAQNKKEQKLRVLILEDNAADAELMERQLRREKTSFQARRTETRSGFLKALQEFNPDIILADYTLPKFDALLALKLAREKSPFLPFIVVTGSIGEEKAAACLRLGADDYLLKDRLTRLAEAVSHAVTSRRLQAERAALEADMERAAERWRTTFDAMNDAVCLLDADGAVRRCNKAMNRLLGLPFRRIIGRNCLELICGEQKRASCAFQQAKKDLRRHKEETLWRGRWYQVAVDPIVDEKGRLSGAVHVMTDITERKGAEKALRDSEQRFRRLYDESPVAFQSLDTEGRFIEVNTAWLKLFGYRREEVIGKPFPAFLAADQADLFPGRFAEFLRRKVVHNIDFRLRKKDGDELIISFDGIFLCDNHGKPIHSNCVLQNITERKHTEELLRESEGRFRSLYENTNIGMYRTTPDGRILMANSALVRMLGYSKFSELAARELEKNGFEPGYPRSVFRERVERDGQVIGLEAAWKRHDDTAIFVRESAVAVRDDDGNIRFYDGTVEDITARRQAEQQIRYQAGLLSQVTDAIMATDRRFRIQYWNEAAEKLYGWKVSDVMGHHFAQFIRPRYVAESRSIVMRKIAREGFWRGELEHGRSDGTYFPVHSSISAVRDSKGRIIGHITVNRDISEHKKWERQLTESEAKFRKAFHSHPGIVGISTLAEGKYIDVNRNFTAILGWPHEEVIGHTSMEIGIFGDYNQRKTMIDTIMSNGALHNFEVKLRTKSGVEKTGLFSAEPIDIEGQPCLLAQIIDISARKRAEEALRASNAMLSQFIQHSPIYAFIKEVTPSQSRVMVASENYNEMIGIPGSEMAGKTMAELFPPEFAAKISADDWDVVDKGKVLRLDEELNDRSYTTIKFPIAIGERMLLAGYTIDITERKRAQELLQATSRRLHLALQSAQAGTWDWDIAKGHIDWSPQMFVLFGLDPKTDSASFESWRKALHPKDRELAESRIAQALEQHKILDNDYRIIMPAGDVRWINAAGVGVYDDQGQPRQMIGICIDITERKLTEERTAASLAEKEILLKEIHHRVKNNLQVISGLLELQAAQIDDERLLRVIRDSQNRIWTMALIHQTLYQSGSLAAIDMADYIRTLSGNLLSSQARVAMPPNVIFDLQPVRLTIDKAIPLALTVNELLTNAMKHAFPDGRPGEIRIALHARNDSSRLSPQGGPVTTDSMDATPKEGTARRAPAYELTVADDGVGLPAGFDPAAQKSLGLQLVTMLVKQLDGTLAFESKAGTSVAILFKADEKSEKQS